MKKSLGLVITLFITAPFLWNCNQEKTLSGIEFEQAVFYEVFPAVIDSIYYDWRLIPPPPPPPDFLEKRGYDVKGDFKKAYDNWEKSDEYKKRKIDWENKRDSIKQDTTSIFLAISDSINQFEREDLYELIKHFKKQNLSIDSKGFDLEKGFKVDLNKLNTNSDKLKFKSQAEFPKGREFWTTNYDFYLDASIEFNRILFDKNKSFGVFNVGLVRGRLNGTGFRIFIKKDVNGKWEIDKIKGTWIS
ncbi:hypothetical protein [Cellulophaga baltica]|uniref:hypothetical protein n=1 Tax=Cellulophaga baltica TaxID=76594 RepID=UPI0024950FD5|nr:hypothetical protein [Cellulophaga baltica]